ncbi:hypothetical protein PISMIDRAFT_671792 [Pisolithus microcarpus 441]|uniref:Uncharacterized protein n=1 Tax=Pisolithus microcarpus 441 TaxID=765257 RepID=A0A0D0A5W1_9AGAM|nr:hypothetical protein PISMIDRAFT_671792 [Pisolithus microcarpus 441]
MGQGQAERNERHRMTIPSSTTHSRTHARASFIHDEQDAVFNTHHEDGNFSRVATTGQWTFPCHSRPSPPFFVQDHLSVCRSFQIRFFLPLRG